VVCCNVTVVCACECFCIVTASRGHKRKVQFVSEIVICSIKPRGKGVVLLSCVTYSQVPTRIMKFSLIAAR
jgi:hypothetical protein